MTISGLPGQSRTAICVGITPTRYRIVQARDGSTVVSGPITTGITNTGTLRYTATIVLPGDDGLYALKWDDGSSAWSTTEDIVVGDAEDDEYGFTLPHVAPTFPVGTSVGAYAPSAWPVPTPGTPGAPGTATTTAT